MPTKSINVPMEEALHRQFKSVAASVGVSEKDLFLRSFIFANTIATKRIVAVIHDKDGNALDFADVMHVTLNGTREMRRVLRSIDSLANRLRALEAFAHGVAESRASDYPALHKEAGKLAKAGPWSDPAPNPKHHLGAAGAAGALLVAGLIGYGLIESLVEPALAAAF